MPISVRATLRETLSALLLAYLFRHTREGGYPFFSARYWIPANEGMTNKRKSCLCILILVPGRKPHGRTGLWPV